MSRPKSIHIEDKIKFIDLISGTPKYIRDIYAQLKVGIISTCGSTDYGYTDKPDFRIANGYVMIELVPSLDRVLIMLRVDKDQSSITNAASLNGFVNPATQNGKPGHWIEFSVNDKNQIQSAINLIFSAYQYRTQNPW